MDSYLTAEISAGALRHNLSLLRRCLVAGTKLCAVVKSDCYGHGLRASLKIIAAGADFLAVATPEEALLLRELGYGGEVLVFFSAFAFAAAAERQEALSELLGRSVSLTVVDEREVDEVALVARRLGREAAVHVKIDTGMARSGALPADVPAVVERIRHSPPVRLAGLYTHLATADESDKEYAGRQLACFRETAAACRAGGDVLLHAANSAAAIDLPESRLSMVRPGIAVYGYQPSDHMHTRLALKPCLRLTGRLMQIRRVPAGTRSGYGLSYEFTRPSTLGLVPIGYGDGYFRSLSNRAVMRVHGRLLPVRGRVSMDQVVLDLTDCPRAAIGDPVEILSSCPADPHSVEGIARTLETIPYEITCRLGRRVRRVLVEDEGPSQDANL